MLLTHLVEISKMCCLRRLGLREMLKHLSQKPGLSLAEPFYFTTAGSYCAVPVVPKWPIVLPKLGNSDLSMARIKGIEDVRYF